MSADKNSPYRRGEYWLDRVRGSGGKPASSRWYIWWYDPKTGHQRRKSTGSDDVRVASDALDAHYLATHRPTEHDQAVYTVDEAMIDYWTEHGRHVSSADAVKARFKLMRRFIDHEADEGRLPEPFLPDHVDDQFLTRFRAWGIKDPIVARKKDEQGNWVDGMSRPRKPSTVEESIIQLKAAIKHAYHARRIRYVPPITHKTRAAVTPTRNDRLSLEGIGELLDYSLRGAGSYTTPERLFPLRRYVIAAICTCARPDAIFDLNVRDGRKQYMPETGLINLNPAGRLQTRKHRPVLPIASVFESWLKQTDDWFVCQERRSFDANQQINVVEQIPVQSIRSAWDTARIALNIPEGRGPKYLRHSMSTILANRGVPPIEISMVLGHQVLDPTTRLYVIHHPEYLKSFRVVLEEVIIDLTRMAGTALHPKLTQTDSRIVVLKA
jgi:integrase